MNIRDESALMEAELLIESLRGRQAPASQEIDWSALLRLCQTHIVLPLVYQALLGWSIETPEFFAQAVLASQMRAEKLALQLKEALELFAREGLEVMPLKGPLLAEELYGGVRMRPCTDLDLLVQAQDFARAERALIAENWAPTSMANDYERNFIRDGVTIELHFRVASPRAFPFDLKGAWKRSRISGFRGVPVRCMTEVDRALYLLVHGLKHGYSKLIWILDAARALNAIPPADLPELIETADAQGLGQVVYIGSAMVMEVFPYSLSRELEAKLAERPKAMGAARLISQKILNGTAGTRTDPDIWSLYLQTETSLVKRWHRRLKFFTPTNEDYDWVSRRRIHRAMAPAIRPFRLLAKYGLRRALRAVFPASA